MKKINILLTCLVLLTISISCNKDEIDFQDLDFSIEIINNTEKGLLTVTTIDNGNISAVDITDHGIIISTADRNSIITKYSLGANLEENNYEVLVNKNLIKGEKYLVRAYITDNDSIIKTSGQLLFESKLDLNIKFTDFNPKEVFIGDTIYIKGENFCTNGQKLNGIELGESFHNHVFSSDTLIKVVLNSTIDKSITKPILINCETRIPIDAELKVGSPVINNFIGDKLYVGEFLKITGTNLIKSKTKVFIGDIECQIHKFEYLKIGQSKESELTVKIPPGIPSGKIKVRVQVLDQSSESTELYESTSPVLSKISPTSIGFLDTLSIHGLFLNQNVQPTIKVGGESQSIISWNDTLIKIILDKSFSTKPPKLELKINDFILSDEFNMLPPKILETSKEIYHFDEFIEIETDNFVFNNNSEWLVGDYSYLTRDLAVGAGSLKFKVSESNYSFVFKTAGVIEIFIKNSFGTDRKNINFYAPILVELEKTSYMHGETINLKGTDLGKEPISRVFIDDKIITDYNSGVYTLLNNAVSVKIPTDLLPGSHKIKIEVGGQFSNEVTFNLEDVSFYSVFPKQGDRFENFTLSGNAVGATYSIFANGNLCGTITSSNSQENFILPQDKASDKNVEITVVYGNVIKKVETISIDDPYKLITDYTGLNVSRIAHFYENIKPFENSDSFYYMNGEKIEKLNIETKKWELIETNIPDDICFYCKETRVVSLEKKIFLNKENSSEVYSYDLDSKEWNTTTMTIPDYEFQSVITSFEGNLIVAASLPNDNKYIFFNYDLNTGNSIQLPLPDSNEYSIGKENNIYSKKISTEDAIYITGFYGEIFKYNLHSNTWEFIPFPELPNTSRPNQNYNLYEYDGILYLSGGKNGGGITLKNLFSYDNNTKVWTLKTLIPPQIFSHWVFGKDDHLYFMEGYLNSGWNSSYSFQNSLMWSYDIDSDK